MLWSIITTVAAIAGVFLGVARYIAAVRKAKADREIGAAQTKNEALTHTVEAAQQRVETDAEVVRLPDADADARLNKWLRD